MSVLKIINPTLCIIACSLLFFNCQQYEKGAGPEKGEGQTANNQAMYKLNASNRSISQPIDPEQYPELSDPNKSKFLEVEVANVINPNKIPVQFEVYYQGENQDKVFLGTFSLYPPDNPGKFIVATQGKIKTKGELTLSLLLPEKNGADNQLQITVKKIRFKKS